ncbi:MAG: hypothetical protein NC483_07665 [Ruminococcus sp.]|nr:hypothetical protein [Ruminococcus sp.]
MRFYEKLTIMIVIFLGVVIATGGIIGTYVKIANNQKNNETSIILEGASF